MSGKYFIDTKHLYIPSTTASRSRKERASTLIQEALKTGTGIISTQVIQEFLNVATQKFAVPMKVEDAKGYTRLGLIRFARFTRTWSFMRAVWISRLKPGTHSMTP